MKITSQFGYEINNLSQIIGQIFILQNSFCSNDSLLIFKQSYQVLWDSLYLSYNLSFGQYITISSIFFQVIESR